MMALHVFVTARLHIPHGYLGGLGPGLGFISPHCMSISRIKMAWGVTAGPRVIDMHSHLAGGFLAPLGAWKLSEQVGMHLEWNALAPLGAWTLTLGGDLGSGLSFEVPWFWFFFGGVIVQGVFVIGEPVDHCLDIVGPVFLE